MIRVRFPLELILARAETAYSNLQMPTLQLPNGTMHYEVQGSGDALLLIPGFASGAWSWEWQAPKLSRAFKVVTFDPIGIGRSKINEGETVSIPAIADDIAALIKTLGLRRVNILGISFGGFVAQDFVLRYSTHVNRLVLASTSFGGPNHVEPSMEVRAAFASSSGLNSADRIRKYMSVAFSSEFVETEGETVERFCRLGAKNLVPREVYIQQLQAALDFNVQHRIGEIEARTLVVTGDRDVVVPPLNSRNLAKAIPNARLEIVHGAGHMAFVEKADDFNGIVTSFLTADGQKEFRECVTQK